MSINTKKVQGRRPVRYESLDELLADAERLAASDGVRTLGNWSRGQIYEHLGRSFDASIDGVGFTLPAPVRWVMSLVMKQKFLKREIPAGFKSTAEYVPGETPTEQGLASLRKAIERQRAESKRVVHPAFGNIGRDGWNDFNLRHAELHMGFLVNGNA